MRQAGTWDSLLEGLHLYLDKYLLKQENIKKQLGTENNYARALLPALAWLPLEINLSLPTLTS